ncbi:Flp pilus assembly protein CpaB [Brevibacillus humidisoli]|uniref:Flp pilus assembly protein CpaB n=1 Tax=Brevibacillus humidisoli TaxID=2895522 RepID=UPI001E5BECE6|nr:Flp pilus assembly protein CpaB [Brevibacillus humidisoli]UFJ41329.1 Flp pilus assembly protein CpaB [Brevibacillus humidisoli]
MRKAGRIIISFLLALAVGGATYFGFEAYAKVQGETVHVLVVREEIPPRTMITPTMFDEGKIVLKELPARAVPPNVFRSPKEVIGKYTVTNYGLPKNSFLFQEKVLPAEEMKDGAAMLIDKGKRMISISVNLRSSLAAQILPGAYIDLWLVAESQDDEPIVGPFLEKAKVIGTYATSSQKSRSTTDVVVKEENRPITIGANTVPQTLLLAVTNDEAAYIQVAEQLGQINITGIGYEETVEGGSAVTKDAIWSVERIQEWMKAQMGQTAKGVE